jgi:murein DD-endopeptidase MepM/ murein hydrolase activator NlpD
VVTCTANDAAGNQAAPVTLSVTVNPPPEPTPTEIPTATEEPSSTDTPESTDTPTPTDTPTDVEEPDTTETLTPTPTETESPTPTKTPTKAPKKKETPTPTPKTVATPAALDLPWPPPESFVIVTDGGPIDSLAAIWGGEAFPITQEFGHTDFSVRHPKMYAYGFLYGLDGYEHPGIDIGMAAGTPLYSPVAGTVKIAGGVPYYTYYGNGQPGVGELMIETNHGDEVILGHMGRIAVTEGQKVKPGQFLGLSGGDNGDHLHLETREIQPGGWYRVVDPRKSFLIPSIAKAAKATKDAEKKTAKAAAKKKSQEAASAKKKKHKKKKES